MKFLPFRHDSRPDSVVLLKQNYTGILPEGMVAKLLPILFLSLICSWASNAQTNPGGVSGSALWLKGDAGVTPGTFTWADQSGNNRNATQTTAANKPTYNAASGLLNFNPNVQFDGINDVCTFGNDLGLTGDVPVSAFYVLSTSAPATHQGILGLAASGGGRISMFLYNGHFELDRNGTGGAKTTTPLPGNQAFLVGTKKNTGNTSEDAAVYFNGKQEGIANWSAWSISSQPMILGARSLPSNVPYGGKMGEVILFTTALTTTQQQQVNSYLAAKYGITLDQSTAQSYLASDGSTKMWDHTATGASTYKIGITVIGRDDASGLNQKQSKSTNSDALITVGAGNMIAADNASNTAAFGANKTFMSFGSNSGSIASWTTTGAPALRRVLPRAWQVQETGTVGSVKIRVPDNSSTGISTLPAELLTVYMLVDADGDFTSGASEIAMTLNGSNWEADIDLTNGQYFTFATVQPSGSVWSDSNNNGIREASETSGFGGVTVRAYDCSGNLVKSTTTNDGGEYMLGTIAPASYPLRIEFSGWPNYLVPTFAGADGQTDVQISAVPEGGVDLGLMVPTDYCQAEPRLAIASFTNGLADNTSPSDAIVSWNYKGTGGSAPGRIAETSKSQTGSVWGLAYARSSKKLYSSTFLKRHVAVKGNLGDIYVTDAGGTSDAALFVTIPDAGTIPSSAARGLGCIGCQSVDAEAWGKVGRVGLGDLCINTNEDTLYTINLNTRQLVIINIATKAMSTVNIPVICDATKGMQPAFAVTYWRGKVYVGVICDALISKNRNDLYAHVLVFDPATGAFSPTPVLSIPMTYAKQWAWDDGSFTYNGESPAVGSTKWYPWVDVWNYDDLKVLNGKGLCHPTPMFVNIEFDKAGNMILGFEDRIGQQVGDYNKKPTNNGDELSSTGGDILKAYNNGSNTSWTIETTIASGGEYFKGDFYGGNSSHRETSHGGMAYNPADDLITLAVLDPVGFNQQGAMYLENWTGNQIGAVKIHGGNLGSGFFGKSSGVGDVEIFCNPMPIEVGNVIWVDADKDGIQDPCESRLGGVKVELYKKDGTVIGQTMTDANGQYLFNPANVDTIAPYGTGGYTGLSANTAYFIVVGKNMAQFNTGTSQLTIGSTAYSLTLSNTGNGVSPDQNDNDGALLSGQTGGAAMLNGYPAYMVMTPARGSNHTYDFGFGPATSCTVSSVTATPGACVPATSTYTMTGSVAFSNAPATGTLTVQVTGGGSQVFNAPFTSPLNYSIADQSADGASHTVTASFSADICSKTATYTAPVACTPLCNLSSVTATPGACVPATSTYTLTGSITFTGAPASGTLTVQITGGGSQVFNAPFTSPLSYSIAGQTADGAAHTVTATFSAAATCTNTANYTAPVGCVPPCALSSVTATPGACVPATSTYTLTGSVTFVNPPATGTLTVQITGGGSQVFNAPFTSPLNYSIAGQSADGVSHSVTATFSAAPACTNTANYTAPVSCALPCTVSVTAAPGACVPATSSYTLTGAVTFSNALALGTLTVQVTGGGSQVFNAPFTSPISYSIASQAADGASHTVTATFSANPACTNSTTYTAPVACAVSCALSSITANPGSCVPAINAYTLTGAVAFVNPPATGTMTVQVTGGGSQVFNAPFTSPISYSIASQYADGASHTVTATFSAIPACTNTTTYTAPAGCEPTCSLSSVTATPGPCAPATGTYTLTGSMTFTNSPSIGTLTVQVAGGGSQVFYAPFTNPISYTIANQAADGASHTVTATFSAVPACTNTATYTAPAPCTAPCSLGSMTAVPGTCIPATSTHTLTGTVNFVNPPAFGTLTVQVAGGGSQVFNAPFGSPISYLIASQPADGAAHTVTAIFSAAPACTNTASFTAPANCTACQGVNCITTSNVKN